MPLTVPPRFHLSTTYHCAPSQDHPHYTIFRDWEGHKASGAVAREEYKLCGTSADGAYWEYTGTATRCQWLPEFNYEVKKTAHHPDNLKPQLKLINWDNVPVGTGTNCGELLFITSLRLATLNAGTCIRTSQLASLRIVPRLKWIAVQNGEPPVCEGLVIEYWCGTKIYLSTAANQFCPSACAYRVIGIAQGYTDNPALAGAVA